ALMTGSGSAVFGIFGTDAEARTAAAKFAASAAFPVRFVTRKRYENVWRLAMPKPSPERKRGMLKSGL
ncbi:MAG: hypothetical protein ACRD4O_19590, partial [Bryobacteraceae bacterium]